MSNPNPDTQLHAFSTFLGLPADTDTPPACGAVLTPAYGNVAKVGRCPECDRLVTEYQARKVVISAPRR